MQLSWMGNYGHFSCKGSHAYGTLSVPQDIIYMVSMHGSWVGLRDFIRKLAKKLTKKRRQRLGLSSQDVVRVRYNAKGRKTVLLAFRV